MIFDRLIEKAIERKAGAFAPAVIAYKGAEPVAVIGGISSLVVLLCKALGIDITEQMVAEIAAGAVTLYAALKAIGNWIKNRAKQKTTIKAV